MQDHQWKAQPDRRTWVGRHKIAVPYERIEDCAGLPRFVPRQFGGAAPAELAGNDSLPQQRPRLFRKSFGSNLFGAPDLNSVQKLCRLEQLRHERDPIDASCQEEPAKQFIERTRSPILALIAGCSLPPRALALATRWVLQYVPVILRQHRFQG